MVLLAGTVSQASAKRGTIPRPDKVSVGAMVPSVPMRMADGTYTTLAKMRRPITLVAISGISADRNTSAHAELASLARLYRDRLLTVADIVSPESANGAGLSSDLHHFDDTDHIAWNAFKKPEQDTLYLIDERGMIQAVESMENLRLIVNKVRWMVLDAEEDEESRYYGG